MDQIKFSKYYDLECFELKSNGVNNSLIKII